MANRMARALGAAALAASLATAGTAVAAPSTERPEESRTGRAPDYRLAVTASGSPPALAGPARRHIHSEVVWRNGRLYLRGDVEDYYRQKVRVQRSGCESCRWRRFDVVRTGRRGWFRSVIRAPRSGSTFWRAKVGASDGYGRSYSATWETYY
jgi:hypothetical protein